MNELKLEDLEGDRVILRTDLNLPVEDGEPKKTERFYRYLDTIEALSEADAKTLIVAHQGRPTRNDFLTLKKHKKFIEEETGTKTHYVNTFFGEEASKTFKKMDAGEIALLENIRFLSEELKNQKPEIHAHDHFVQKISEVGDIFVNDAFSVAHRSHGSIVGFSKTLPTYAGPVMKKEVESCNKVKNNFDEGTLILGGEKPKDIVGMLQSMIEDVDNVLLGGIPGEVALITKNYGLGGKEEWIKEKSYSTHQKELKKLLEKYEDKIKLPKDLSTRQDDYKISEIPDDEMTWDIGPKTAQEYARIIENSESVLMKGPMGAFEEHEEGTKQIIDAIAKSNGYTVLGGGHTSSLVERFGHDLEDFSHVSIAGGAFVRYMSGEKLPGVETLEN